MREGKCPDVMKKIGREVRDGTRMSEREQVTGEKPWASVTVTVTVNIN